jgi:hypothetical protein
MKNITSANPRLVCWVVRSVRVLFEKTGNAHISTCADCRAFYRTAGELDRELRNAGVALRRVAMDPTHDLAGSILRAVREKKSETAPAPAHSRTPMWAVGMSAMAAAAIAVVIYFQAPAVPGPTSSGAADALAVVEAVEDFSIKLTETVIPATGAMMANNPLQRELGSVYSDARAFRVKFSRA